MGGARWHRQDWHRLSIAEKIAEQRRRHDEQFVVREYRCRRCITVVDGPSRPGHLRRCQGIAAALTDDDMLFYFAPVSAKGAGWRVDAAAQSAVQQAAGGSMEGNGQMPESATPAEKREWAAVQARDMLAKDPEATGAALLEAIKARFGAGISHRVCGAIMRDARAQAKPAAAAAPVFDPAAFRGTPEPGAVPGSFVASGPLVAQTAPPPSVVEDVIELIRRMRALGVNSFQLGGREFAVP